MTRRSRMQLWTAAQSAAADRYTMDTLGLGSPTLMERASLCVAHEVAARAGTGPVRVLVGPGNNGGDGLAVARLVHGWGLDVTAHLATDKRGPAAEAQLGLCRAVGVRVETGAASVPASCVLVDGLLGTGATGAPRGGVSEALRSVSQTRGPRIAIDIPSGVDPDTGAAHDAAFRADATVTFARSKPGLHITPGRGHAGVVVVADIGIAAPPGATTDLALIDPAWVAAVVRGLPTGPHKGARGHVAVIGGSTETPGAAVLAATAALRGGAGLATIVTRSEQVRSDILKYRPEIMIAAPSEPPLPAARALVVGPGLTDVQARAGLAALFVEDERPALWDASALDDVPLRGHAAGPRIVTPHPGEAARMLARAEPARGWTAAQVQADRLAVARRLAELTAAVAVLKGEGTIVADPGGAAAVCVTGTAALSTAGSGDALAGLGGALLGRGLGAFEAACVAAHAHGLAGELAAARYPLPLAMEVADACADALADRGLDRPVALWPTLRRG